MGLPSVSTGNMSLLKFAAVAGAGVWIGDKLHTFAQEKFPDTFGGDITTAKEWMGYAIVGLGVAGALLAAHAVFGRKS
jgi:hypothetical protein